ncbi:MAG: phospholipase [Rhodoferax sp.]
MRALNLHAGPTALRHLAQHGLQAGDVATVPGAAGGPKGLILGRLDQFIFGDWLAQSSQSVDLVGASIGAWRMATACLNGPVAAFERLEHDYIRQHYELQPGEKRPPAARVSALFEENLKAFYGGRVNEVLQHPRYRLHIITSRGRHVLNRETAWRTPLGYLGAFVTNTVHRKAMGAWLERVVFSTGEGALPFATQDYRTRALSLTEANFYPALQASCSIPFVLRSVSPIPGAPPGAYWDGGLIDYHLHLNYLKNQNAIEKGAACTDESRARASNGLVIYPHFQSTVVPGWLDKHLRWRHRSTHFLDNMVVLSPNPEWVKTLPNGKLPDRTDFTHYGPDLAGRVKAWTGATSASSQLVDEFQAWLARPDMAQVQALV